MGNCQFELLLQEVNQHQRNPYLPVFLFHITVTTPEPVANNQLTGRTGLTLINDIQSISYIQQIFLSATN